MQKSVDNALVGLKINEKYGDIPFYSATKSIFSGLQELINNQSPTERKKAAVDRFKAYVNGHEKYKPLLEAYKNRILFREAKFKNHKKYYSLKKEIELYLSESSTWQNKTRTCSRSLYKRTRRLSSNGRIGITQIYF
ncbi:MAG TPA: hypothetical protein VI754_15400 [Bacteriovoracaceae bacterium]|nr:hypothetical protein [Bacteriovoracaceae bacterium]